MKKLRKLVSLLLAVVMIMGLCATQVMADTGSIVIDRATVGETYAVYKIFDLTYNETTGSYAYYIDTTTAAGAIWYNFFTNGDGADYVNVDSNGYFTWDDSVDTDTKTMQEFGAKIENVITQNSSTILPEESKQADSTTVTFSNLDLGYYYVTSTVGSLIALTSTDTTANIVDKNDKPTIEKSVATENVAASYDDEYVTADLSDTIYFKIKITGIDEIYSLTFYDNLPSCYTLNASSVVVNLVSSVGTYVLSDNNASNAYYTLNNSSGTNSIPISWDFSIVFDQLFSGTTTGTPYYDYVLAASTPSEAYIEIIYSVTVDSSKVSFSSIDSATGNTNTAYITSSTGNTVDDDASVYYYDLYIYKYAGTDPTTGTALSGAVFTLQDDDTGKYAKFSANTSTTPYTYTLTGWVDAADITSDCYITTGTDGFIYIKGLNVGNYTITETTAPDGYALASSTFDATITADSVSTSGSYHYEIVSEYVTVGASTDKAIAVINTTNSAMPSTGGTGVVGYYVFGGILVLAAAAVMIGMRKRKVN